MRSFTILFFLATNISRGMSPSFNNINVEGRKPVLAPRRGNQQPQGLEIWCLASLRKLCWSLHVGQNNIDVTVVVAKEAVAAIPYNSAKFHEWISGAKRLPFLRYSVPVNYSGSAVEFKSSKRTELVKAGYRIVGNMGDQWTDLIGENPGSRTFKEILTLCTTLVDLDPMS
ncbi:hypothetical protein HAX54_051275 [Datura stramonium]|uniref:Uncharacterized protein n=1 Tax=Datura stramonium TaxID=4076 RepID=A0ABS8RUP7_DATST|nr:hypothetical protein [Datura stramonium]